MDGPERPEADDEELLDAGARRPSRWATLDSAGRLPHWLVLARRGVITVAVLTILIFGIRAVSQPPRSTKAASAPTVSPSAQPPGAGEPGPLEAVRALAQTPGRLTDFVRVDTPSGICPPVALDHSPVQDVLRAEHAHLGTVRLVDSARTIDQSTGLCELAVRSRLGATVITVAVTAPARSRRHLAAYVALETGVETVGRTTVEYAQARSREGWRVIVGATGRLRDLPTSRQLQALSQAGGLLW